MGRTHLSRASFSQHIHFGWIMTTAFRSDKGGVAIPVLINQGVDMVDGCLVLRFQVDEQETLSVLAKSKFKNPCFLYPCGFQNGALPL